MPREDLFIRRLFAAMVPHKARSDGARRCASVRKDVGPNFNSGVQNRNFTANWICRDVPTIEVICPALERFPV